MKRKFQFREVAFVALPLLILLVFVAYRALYPAPSGSRQEQEEAIQEVVLVRALRGNGEQPQPQVVHLSVNRQNPTSSLCALLLVHHVTLRPLSETSWVNGGVVESATGRPSSQYVLDKVQWLTPTSAKVSLGRTDGNISGAGEDYTVNWSKGRWVVKKSERTWVS